MREQQLTVISAYGLGSEVSLVVFQDDATGERAVQMLPVSIAAIAPEILQELLEWPAPPAEDAEIVTVKMDVSAYQAVQAWCRERQVTFEQVALALIRFCTDRRYASIALPWLKETIRAITGAVDLDTLPVITEEELHQHFDRWLQQLEDGGDPIRIRCEDQSELLLFRLPEDLEWFSLLSATEETQPTTKP